MHLSHPDFEKFKRLRARLGYNYRMASLFAAYLSHCPTLIPPEAVEALTVDGSLSEKEAVAALLAEAMGIDAAGGPEDRLLYREYLLPAVRILDADDFLKDPYILAVRSADTAEGTFALKNEIYPAYRGAISGDMEVSEELCEIPPLGFFAKPFPFLAVTEGGNEWMTLTPADTVTSREAITAARGQVITFGLGLGYYAFHAAERAEVESVTVIEKSPEVIRLFKRALLPLFPHGEKIRIIEADAFEYAEHTMPKERYDIAFVDTWRDASDGCPMYVRMKPLEKKNPTVEFHYWIEGFLLSRLRSLRFASLCDRLEEGGRGQAGDITYSEIYESLTDEALRRDAKEERLEFSV